MNGIIAYIIGGLGSIASVLTILQYFGVKLSKLKSKKTKGAIFVIVVLSAIVLFGYWYQTEKENQKINIEKNTEKVKYELLKNDAKDISAAIKIYGGENAGDYIGYLTLIVGFYGRHKDIYQFEYDAYNKKLDEFIIFFKDKRDRKEFLWSSEWEELRGLVNSGREILEKLSNSKE